MYACIYIQQSATTKLPCQFLFRPSVSNCHLLRLPHVDNATDAIASLHVTECLVDLVQWLSVGDEFVDLQLAGHVVVNEVRELSAALDTTEGTTLPYTASNELECCRCLLAYVQFW